jgi:hypothetical protein
MLPRMRTRRRVRRYLLRRFETLFITALALEAGPVDTLHWGGDAKSSHGCVRLYKAEDRSGWRRSLTRWRPKASPLQDVRIGGGTNWHQDIEQHLEAAKCVVVRGARIRQPRRQFVR